MSILVVGLSHRTSALATLERVAFPAAELDKALFELQQAPHINEVMLLSTCNRVEVYAVVDAFHGGLADVTAVLARQAGLEPAALYSSLYVHYAGAAVEHIFSVAAGLDSMVVGETQILGQVRGAYATARAAGTVGRVLHELVQNTLRVGKRVHAETGLGQLGASVVSEALSAAGELRGKRALVFGAGSMAALAAAHLRKAEVADITVINRTQANAVRLAEAIRAQGTPAQDAPVSALARVLASVDVAVSCAGGRDIVLVREHVLPREQRPLVVCDLGLPRNVDQTIAELPLVRLVDLETVRRRMERGSGEGGSAKQIARATGIVLDEVRAYLASQCQAEVTPTVTALRKRAAEVVDAELLRLDRRLPDLDSAARAEVTQAVRRVVDKLLHTPTVRVKELATKTSGTDYADALRELFGLDPQAPVTVSSSAVGPHGGFRARASEVHSGHFEINGDTK